MKKTQSILAASFIGVFSLMAIPAISFAASYAYVNQQGEVMMVTANDPMTAINTAPNRAVNSGVMLLDSPADSAVVGDNVSGTK